MLMSKEREGANWGLVSSASCPPLHPATAARAVPSHSSPPPPQLQILLSALEPWLIPHPRSVIQSYFYTPPAMSISEDKGAMHSSFP